MVSAQRLLAWLLHHLIFFCCKQLSLLVQVLSIIVYGGILNFLLKNHIFFGPFCVCSKILDFVSFRKFCSAVADLKFKCLVCLPGMNFY